MARYDDALALAAADETTPDLAAARTGEQTKFGVGVGVEHRLSGDVGLFARLMHADGRTETYAFTEDDASASGGVSIGGARWGRSADTVGLAGALNTLSVAHGASCRREG